MGVSTLYGTYVIVIDQGWAVVYALAVTALLAVFVPWLANLPQGTPQAIAWPNMNAEWQAHRRHRRIK